MKAAHIMAPAVLIVASAFGLGVTQAQQAGTKRIDCSGMISAPPDARSSRCASTSTRGMSLPGTRILAKRSSMDRRFAGI